MMMTRFFTKFLCVFPVLFTLGGCPSAVPVLDAMGKMDAAIQVLDLAADLTDTSLESSSATRFVGSSVADDDVCNEAVLDGKWETRPQYIPYVQEAQRRGLTCGVGGSTQTVSGSKVSGSFLASLNANRLCGNATRGGRWETSSRWAPYVKEAKRRGLSCGVGQASSTQSTLTPSNNGSTLSKVPVRKSASEKAYEIGTLCDYASVGYPVKRWRDEKSGFWDYVKTAKRKGLTCGVDEIDSSIQIATGLNAKSTAPSLAAASNKYRHYDNSSICSFSTTGNPIYWLMRFYTLFESMVKYLADYLEFLDKLKTGIFIQYTTDIVLQDVDGKQLMCECLYLYGTMLLLLERHIPGPVREKMVIAVMRHQGEMSLEHHEDVCKLIRATGYDPADTNKHPKVRGGVGGEGVARGRGTRPPHAPPSPNELSMRVWL